MEKSFNSFVNADVVTALVSFISGVIVRLFDLLVILAGLTSFDFFEGLAKVPSETCVTSEDLFAFSELNASFESRGEGF